MMAEVNDEILIRELEYYSDDYKKELELRDEVLRKPLGMSLSNDHLEVDMYDTHIGALMGNQLVGVLLLTKLSAADLKMRQVAVLEKLQSQKIGSKMVLFAEAFAVANGFKNMVLNARKTAVPFYEKLGYETEGEEFLEINIPHYKMHKHIC